MKKTIKKKYVCEFGKIDITKLREDMKNCIGDLSGFEERHFEMNDEDFIINCVEIYGEESMRDYLIK